MGQLAHVQMLAVQWAPMAILALHLYLETRATRWLALFGAAWLLQALSNGYALFFLSVFVGFWMLWFVVLRRRWQTAVSIALTMALASVPLAPILSKYVAVHARNGFTRGPAEVRAYSADAMGFLCAPFEVSAWGWMQQACVPEGELFPGLFTGLLFAAGFLLRSPVAAAARARSPLAAGASALLAIVFAAVQLASALAVAVGGPWNVECGPRFRACRVRRRARSCSRWWRWRWRSSSSPGFAARCATRRRSPSIIAATSGHVVARVGTGPQGGR